MASSARPFSIYTPELLWHGGGNERGKPDPVYSVDFHPTEPILLTTGIDANVPPKGSVRVLLFEFFDNSIYTEGLYSFGR